MRPRSPHDPFHVSQQGAVQAGKFLEASLLGEPYKFQSKFSVAEAIQKGKLVAFVRAHLASVMQEVRDHQKEDPSYPKRPFLKKLLRDIENHLASQYDLPASYELRINSAVGTILDWAGVDFWIELYDADHDIVLTDYKIDLKSNPHRAMGALADYLYYCDEEAASSEDRNAIFKERDYIDLVESVAKHLALSINSKHRNQPITFREERPSI